MCDDYIITIITMCTLGTWGRALLVSTWTGIAKRWQTWVTKSAKNIFDISSKVLSQICSTLFDYPAIRECEELVGSFVQNPNCFFFCHLFSYRRCGTLEIALTQRGASRHSAPSTWSSNFHPQHNWSSTIWLEHLRLYMAVYHYLDYDHSHSHHHDHHHGHHDQLPMCPPDMRSASSKARCTSGSTARWRPALRWDIQMISKVKPFNQRSLMLDLKEHLVPRCGPTCGPLWGRGGRVPWCTRRSSSPRDQVANTLDQVSEALFVYQRPMPSMST